MNRKHQNISVSLPVDDIAYLTDMATKEKRPLSWIVRNIIDKFRSINNSIDIIDNVDTNIDSNINSEFNINNTRFNTVVSEFIDGVVHETR